VGVSVPTSALQDAVALLTVAMHAGGAELEDLVAELQAKGRSNELLLAMIALCRSLCLTTARLAHALEDQLTDAEVLDLTDAEVRAAALEVVRAYARNAVPIGELPSS
jgi:hypothetical protein